MACVDVSNQPDKRLIKAIFGYDEVADYREIVIAHKRKGDPKAKVRTNPMGRLYIATHWMPLPEPPEAA